MAARSWSALAEQSRSWRSAALARCSAFCSAWRTGQGAATSGGGGMVSGEPQDVCWQALCWQALCWQALCWQALCWQAWAGHGLVRGWADAWLSHLQEPLRLWIRLPWAAATASATRTAVATSAAASASAAAAAATAAAAAAAAAATSTGFQR